MPARSYLYVPGDRPDRLEKAVDRAGDAVIADLEDAVAPSRKDEALAAVLAWLPEVPAGVEVWVRVADAARTADDLAALAAHDRLDGVVLAKATEATARAARDLLPAGLLVAGLVETAGALLELRELAGEVDRLGIGEADLCAALGVAPDEEAVLGPLRTQLVVASAAAGLPGPTGPVHLAVRDLDGLRTTTEQLRRRGFGARSAIHPDQVAVIEDVFTPSPDEVARARELVAAWDAAGGGVAVDGNGRFVDEAVVRISRRVVETADRLNL